MPDVSMNTVPISKLRSLLRNYSAICEGYTYYRNIKHHEVIRRAIHFILRGHFIRWLRVLSFLHHNDSNRSLQVGGGRHTIREEGWLNGDIIAGDIYLDAAKPLPFPSYSLSYIFAEQFIEHLTFKEARNFLNESYRILRTGGVIRLATPDMEGLIQTYYNKNPQVSLEDAMERHRTHHNPELTTPCHFLNDCFRFWGHRFLYDEESLRQMLSHAGFADIRQVRFGESSHKQLEGLERHADSEWMKHAWTLILEATRD